MARHRPRTTPPEFAISAVGVLRRNGLLMAVANTGAAAGLLLNDPGMSASLAFLKLAAPLPVWAVPFAVAAFAQIANRPLIGHSVAVLPWLMLALGAVLGVVGRVSSAPSAALILASLALYCAGHHINSMVFRRQEQRARRDR